MSRYLVIANQTAGGEQLRDELRRRATDATFFVLVPAMPVKGVSVPTEMGAGDTGIPASVLDDALSVQADRDAKAEMANHARLTQLIAQIKADGGVADGEVGPTDVLQGIAEIQDRGPFDEIIISTLPPGISRWLRMDVPSRVQRRFGVPVTTVTQQG
jgi:hypothetical protein